MAVVVSWRGYVTIRFVDTDLLIKPIMNTQEYSKIYDADYFSGKNSFFYSLGYDKVGKFGLETKFNNFLKYLNLGKTASFLDIGCAFGFLFDFVPKKYSRYGIDVSEFAIEQARIMYPYVTFTTADIEQEVPFKNVKFDYVTAYDVLEHLKEPEKALNIIYSILKPGGLLHILIPNLNKIRRFSVYRYADKREHHFSMLNQKEWRQMLLNAGFKVIEDWTFLSLPGLQGIKLQSDLGTEYGVICERL